MSIENMSFFKKAKSSITDFLVDHPTQRTILKWIGITFFEALSGLIFAFGFKAFINPSNLAVQEWKSQGDETITNSDIASPDRIISGGASGISQIIIKILLIFIDLQQYRVGNTSLESFLVSILYFVVNIPLVILAWKKISKQFTIFTLLNVGFTSLFMNLIPDVAIAKVINLYSDMIARAIFAGITTGLSSGMAMAVGSSAGGLDILMILISEKKSTTVGKYSLVFNTIIVFTYVLVSIIGHAVSPSWNTQDNNKIITLALYTVVYSFVTSKIMDLINIKNKKQELQIFTSDVQLPQVLVHSFPHTCTIIESKGAFSGKKNYVVYMVISKSELKKATQIIRTADPFAFFTITDIKQVYGRFYIKPID